MNKVRIEPTGTLRRTMHPIIPSLLLLCSLLPGCSAESKGDQGVPSDNAGGVDRNLDSLSTAIVASGCFWCVEAIFESLEGVPEAISGYAGGEEEDPTYSAVSAGRTGHAEAVLVYYDSTVIDYPTLLRVYYGSHDPTTVDGQAPDFGRQYRSVIFWGNEEERRVAERFRDSLDASGAYDEPIATEIVGRDRFWPAEEYHQDFERRNPEHPYVRQVSIPRLERFRERFPALLKSAGEERAE